MLTIFKFVAVANILAGFTVATVSDEGCGSVAEPEDFTFVAKNGLGILSWFKPMASINCNLKYKLELTMNEKEFKSFETTAEYYIFDHIQLCSNFEAKLTAIDIESSVESNPLSRQASTGIVDIVSLDVSSTLASWVVPPYAEECQYKIEIGDVIDETVHELQYEIPSDSALVPCKLYNLTVTPMDAKGNDGTPVPREFQLDPEEIKSISANGETLEWQPRSECTFEVQINDETPEEVTGSSYDLSELKLSFCDEHRVSIRTLPSRFGKTRVLYDGTFKLQPESLKILSDNIDGNVEISWSVRYDKCTIKIELEGVPQDYVNQPFIIETKDMDYCQDYSLTASIDDENGSRSKALGSTVVRRPILSITEFEIKQNTDDIKAEWDINLKQCSAIIRINGTAQEPVTGSSMSLAKFPFDYCVSYNISLDIDEDEYTGDPVNKDFTKNEGDIKTFQIQDTGSGVEATWSTDVSNCVLEITINETAIAEPISNSSVIIPSDYFKYCENYDFTLKASSEDGTFSISKIYSSFQITTGKLRELQVTQQDGGEIFASWSSDFDMCEIVITLDDVSNTFVKGSNDGILQNINLTKLIYCEDYTVTGQASCGDENYGELAETLFHKTAVDWTVSYFKVEENDEVVIAKWSTDFDSCTNSIIDMSTYHIYYNLTNGDTLSNSDFKYCKPIQFIARFNNESLQTRDTFTKALAEQFEAISDVELKDNGENKLLASWKKLEVIDCTLKYTISYTLGDDPLVPTESFEDTEYLFEDISITSTTFFSISIQPIYDSLQGMKRTCKYKLDTTNGLTITLESESDSVCLSENMSGKRRSGPFYFI